MGRELKRVGAPFRQPEWSALALMQAPDTVVKVHRSFIDAGAQVITTNNYAVVPFHLGKELFATDGMRLTALSGELARQSVQAAVADGMPAVRVGGSLPPLCGSYRPDLFNETVAKQVYPSIVKALEPNVDLWQAETMASIAEARAVAKALEQSTKPVWLSFSLIDDQELETPLLRSGEKLGDALALAAEIGAEALLFNCSLPEVIGQAIAGVAPLRDKLAATLLLGGYGNAFTPRRSDAQANSDEAQMRSEITPEHYLSLVNEWESHGASIFGGCCGIGPEYIERLALSTPGRIEKRL